MVIVLFLLCSGAPLPVSAQLISSDIGVGDMAADRVLVRLRPDPLTARVQSGVFTPELAEQLTAALGGRSSIPLFGNGQPDARQLARIQVPIPGALPAESESIRGARLNRFGLDRWIVLYLPEGEGAEEALLRLEIHPLVEIVEPDYLGKAAGAVKPAAFAYSPNDPLYDLQWYFEQPSDADIDMSDAWDIARAASDVPVAVLDSGVQLNHPDLRDALLLDWDWDYVNNDPYPSDDAGHGTHVTGLIAATGDNGEGIAGTAFRATIIPLKVLDDDLYGYYSDWSRAFRYAADLGVRIINLSAGGSTTSSALHSAIQYAYDRGVVICTAMMNFGDETPRYPAAYEETIAVGATDRNDQRADPFSIGENTSSSFGEHIDLIAPGDLLISTYFNGDYTSGSGTSQATPLVSGVAALMISLNTDLEPEGVRSILRITTDDQVGRPSEDTPGFDIYHGAGRLNAGSALADVAAAVTIPTTFDAPPPRPNPSYGPVRFPIDLSETEIVTLRIFDTRGRLIRILLDAVSMPAGHHLESWYGADSNGQKVPSGIYIYELIVGSHRVTGKLIRLK